MVFLMTVLEYLHLKERTKLKQMSLVDYLCVVPFDEFVSIEEFPVDIDVGDVVAFMLCGIVLDGDEDDDIVDGGSCSGNGNDGIYIVVVNLNLKEK